MSAGLAFAMNMPSTWWASSYVLAHTPIPAPTIKNTVRKILEGPDFSDSNSWVIEQIFGAIRYWLKWFMDLMTRGLSDPDKGNLPRMLFAILILAIIVVIGYVVIMRRRRVRVYNELMQEIVKHTPGEWLAQAKEAEGMAQYDAALLHRWRSLVAQALQAELLRDFKGKTTRSLAADLRVLGASSAAFDLLTDQFEGIRYGSKHITQAQYVEAVRECDGISQAIEAHRASRKRVKTMDDTLVMSGDNA